MVANLKHYSNGPSGPDSSQRGEVAIDHGNIVAASVLEATVAWPGAKVGDLVNASPKSTNIAALGIAYGGARVTAADTIGITLVNPTAGAVNPAEITWVVQLVK